jgi:phage terminase small subunit
MAKKKLSSRELAFCRYTLTEKDQTSAAIKAKYSPKTARKQASRLLTKADIQKEIKRLRDKAEDKTLDLRAQIQSELRVLAFADMKDYVTIGEEGQVVLKTFDAMPSGASRAIASVEETRRIMGSGTGENKDMVMEIKTKYRHHDKLGALKELNKSNGLYPEEGTGEAKVINYVFGNEKK